MRFGIAILRAVVGGLFIGHGLQKLTGAFGGQGLEATAAGFEQLGLRPGRLHATAAGTAETAGGALLLAGLATPLAAGALTGTMTVAIDKVHAAHGPWVASGGYEYNAVLMAAVFAITAEGPGAVSLDRRRWGTGWAVAELAAGVAGAAALLRFANQQPEPATEPIAEPQSPEPVGIA